MNSVEGCGDSWIESTKIQDLNNDLDLIVEIANLSARRRRGP